MLPTKSTKFSSRYLIDRLSEGDEIWHDGSPDFAVHNAEIGKLWPSGTKLWPMGSPWGAKILKGVKKFLQRFSRSSFGRAL